MYDQYSDGITDEFEESRDSSTESQHSMTFDEIYDEEGIISSIGDLVFTDITLGRGEYGMVKLAKRLSPQELYNKRSHSSIFSESGSSHSMQLGKNYSFVAVKIYKKSVLKRIINIKRANSNTSNKTEIHTALENVQKEIALMKMLRHPNIVSLLQVIDSVESNAFYIILEYLPLGEIMTFDHNTRRFKHRHRDTTGLTRNGYFREDIAAKFFVDVLHGLAYLHRNCIAHCDLKPENILLSNKRIAKISDFGVSHLFEEERERSSLRSDLQKFKKDDVETHTHFTTTNSKPTLLTRYDTDTALEMDCMSDAGFLNSTEGTYTFWSPEMCSTSSKEFSGYASDMWAAGICLYIFCSGKLPFDSDSPPDLFHLILEADLPLEGLSFSKELKDLLCILLHKDPNQRAGVGDCLKHEFCKMARIERIELLGESIRRSSEVNIVVNKEDERKALSIAKLAKTATTKMSKRILSAKELFARPKMAKTISSISTNSNFMESTAPNQSFSDLNPRKHSSIVSRNGIKEDDDSVSSPLKCSVQ